MLIECCNADCSVQFAESFSECPGCQTARGSVIAEEGVGYCSGRSNAPSGLVLYGVPIGFCMIGGDPLVIPSVLALSAGFVASKSLPNNRTSSALLLSFSLQAAHCMSMLMAFVFWGVRDITMILGLLVAGVATLWLLIRPNVVVAALLAVYQFSFVTPALAHVQSTQLDYAGQRSVLVFVLFRLVAIYAMCVAIFPGDKRVWSTEDNQ